MADDSVAGDQLRAFIERLERLDQERRAIVDDMKEIRAEAKGNGFSVPVINEILKIRRKDHSERMEFEAILEIYLTALGMAVAPKDDDDGDDDPTPRGRQSQPAYQAEAAGLRREVTTSFASVSGQYVQKMHELVTTPAHDAETGEILEDESAAGIPAADQSPQPEADGLAEAAASADISLPAQTETKTVIKIIGDGSARLMLTKGQWAIIDQADIPLVQPHSWYAHSAHGDDKRWYASTHVPRGDGTYAQLRLHRLILGVAADQMVDHADGDGLNNRRANLRPCTNSQNAANMIKAPGVSGYRGVSKRSDASTFVARIMADGTDRYLGSFATAVDAAMAYDRAALETFGEFARLNFSYGADGQQIHERASTNDKASPEAGPQAEASPAGIGTGTLADREARHEGEAASADLPAHLPETANEPQPQAAQTVTAHEPVAASLPAESEAVAISAPIQALNARCLGLRPTCGFTHGSASCWQCNSEWSRRSQASRRAA